MLYVGTSLPTPSGDNDPCLIDPSKTVAGKGDFRVRETNYWPSYSSVTPSARRAYLNWLLDGRRNPEADIGYVFLFFYGLERRALVDASRSDEARKDFPAIAKELQELLAVYGSKSGSFHGYGHNLLNFIQLADHSAKLYEKPVPPFARNFELPLYIRVALGQASRDGAPVPAPLALAWVRLGPDVYFRTPATRCAEQFDKLFQTRYEETFGRGIELPRNRTKLKFAYHPASAGFRGYPAIRLSFGELPDVTVLTGPIRKLQAIVEQVTKELEPYSRFVGRNPEAKDAFEGLLQLPAAVRPPTVERSLAALKARVGSNIVAMPYREMLANLGVTASLAKDKALGLIRALESAQIGIEPDVLAGARLPKPEDNVVLFPVLPGEQVQHGTSAYRAAVLTLQLATAAAANGGFGEEEALHFKRHIVSWTQLGPNQQRRLLAHLELLAEKPVSLTVLKKKLEPMGQSAKEMVASFMATFVQSGGKVTSAEMRMLEKVYKALGVESKKVFSDVHAIVAGGAPVQRVNGNGAEFRLDAARIAVLQRDSEKVSGLLADIFKEEEVATPVQEHEEANGVPKGLLGLDGAYAAFARALLTRPEWPRSDLVH